MKRRILLALAVLCLPILTGCVISDGQRVVTRTVVWAKMGTPARIVDDRKIRVLVPDGAGGWTPGAASLVGMVAIDEPTLEYYKSLHEKASKKDVE